MQYYTQADHKSAVEWLYPGGHLDFSATILCSTNESVDTWNAIAQGMNPSEEHILRSKDSFSEVDDINGHLKKMLSGTLLNGFRKNGVPNHELTWKLEMYAWSLVPSMVLALPTIQESALLQYTGTVLRLLP